MRTIFIRWCLLSGLVAFACNFSVWSEPVNGAEPEANQSDIAGGDAEHHGEPPGPITATPQDVDLAFWTLIVFLIIRAILKKFAWGPLSEGLNKREENIRKDIDDAEAARVKAEQMLAAHAEKLDQVQNEVREIIAEARRDADHTKQEIITTAQTEAEATKHRAISEIERAKDAALKELFDTMAARVTDATEHVLGRSLSSEDQERFIQEALSQFSEN